MLYRRSDFPKRQTKKHDPYEQQPPIKDIIRAVQKKKEREGVV